MTREAYWNSFLSKGVKGRAFRYNMKTRLCYIKVLMLWNLESEATRNQDFSAYSARLWQSNAKGECNRTPRLRTLQITQITTLIFAALDGRHVLLIDVRLVLAQLHLAHVVPAESLNLSGSNMAPIQGRRQLCRVTHLLYLEDVALLKVTPTGGSIDKVNVSCS